SDRRNGILAVCDCNTFTLSAGRIVRKSRWCRRRKSGGKNCDLGYNRNGGFGRSRLSVRRKYLISESLSFPQIVEKINQDGFKFRIWIRNFADYDFHNRHYTASARSCSQSDRRRRGGPAASFGG